MKRLTNHKHLSFKLDETLHLLTCIPAIPYAVSLEHHIQMSLLECEFLQRAECVLFYDALEVSVFAIYHDEVLVESVRDPNKQNENRYDRSKDTGIRPVSSHSKRRRLPIFVNAHDG